MAKIAIEINCDAEHCANCDDLTIEHEIGEKKGFCEMFWENLKFEPGKDFKRLPVCLNAEIKGMESFDPEGQIAIIWSIDDVKQERPRLTNEQAMEVLREVKHHHDADYGVCWETLRTVADNLFPGNEQEGDNAEN